MADTITESIKRDLCFRLSGEGEPLDKLTLEALSQHYKALWQTADALALQNLDALLSMEAGVMGMSKDTPMGNLLFAGKSSFNAV